MQRSMIGAVLAATLIGVTLVAQTVDPQAIQRMVATERAFAAATAEIGVRDGFLSFFADDAVQIVRGPSPGLTPARAALEAQALPKLPIANRLLWEPYTGHVSSDGTLGWLTGGFVQMNQAQQVVVGQGAYFSVWKRQTNGTWRVWLDEGIALPQIWQGAAPFRTAPDPDTGTAGTASETIDQAESAVAADRDAWIARIAADARLHIDGKMPLVGREAITASMRPTMRYAVMRTEAAASGDLGIVIGSFETARGNNSARGTFVRVWKRDAAAHWRIVFQTEKQ